ncbi:nucleotidyl transferase AbiEii/AbiGii toxin family protein [Tahibacter amnicola]|uniref:Nucleotidyl transferase AbiEii/AbiGii toxin family protein n=1 Tax=Tahibacter amnicola TaxID=2976241 RepID=A0ABY6BDI2_9GAMM|nr:nucleotidyl transferase AbiEii/AbiGii toxin family protein [Tahibacter amnicola]UXI68091.1 nucleotidyl transferase AbiEii/AbiGii toxin family protein [Tahibacter amnicola]
MKTNLAASVRARLLLVAKRDATDFNQVLIRFALERLLYRLGISRHADRFLLKGALLFTLWYAMPHRSTRDADLLGSGPCDLDTVRATFQEIAAMDGHDGLMFDPVSVTADPIRKDTGYAGVRLLISASLTTARVKAQVDVGFGDAVTPGPVAATYPVLLDDLPAPTLRTYPVYTVIAEKLHAIALLGMANTRLKDYFDLKVLLEREAIDHDVLADAVSATFARRGMRVPADTPVGLTTEFSRDESRRTQWTAFLRKNELAAIPLEETVNFLRDVLSPALSDAQLRT